MRTASTERAALALALLAGCGQEYQVVQGPVDINPGDIAECGFSPISGTRLSVYDCNPVFAGSGEGWAEGFVSVGFRTQQVLGHPFYQIWYTARNPAGDRWGLGYAVSHNGTDWTPHPDNPLLRNEEGAWDQDQMDGIQIIWDAARGEYVLWYQGYQLGTNAFDPGQWGIGVKTSPDGVAWSNLKGNGMVLDLQKQYNGVDYCWPLGVSWDASTGYSGYMAGGETPPPGAFPNCEVYRFTGDDLDHPNTFDFGARPVLEAGPEPYDAAGHASVAVVEWAEDAWYMFYVGFSDWQDNGNVITSQNHSFNLATSTDGKNWVKDPDNPLPVNNASPGVVRDVAAQKYGSRILLWITDYYEELDQNAVGFYIYEPDIDPHP